MDVDIVADPDDIEGIKDVAHYFPDWALIAEHKLWPASTHLPEWVWAFGPMNGDRIHMTQEYRAYPEWIAAGLVYYPRILLELALPHMPAWDFGQADITLSKMCREHGIPMKALPHVRPKHVHFNPGDDYLAWTRPA